MSTDRTPFRAAHFERVFRATYIDLCALSERLVGHGRAEDVVQEVFASVWAMDPDGDDARLERAYLYRAVRNRCLHHLRHDRIAGETSDVLPSLPSPDNILDDLTHDEITYRLSAAVAALPERMRMVFILRRDHGLSYAEIAESMEISISTVEVQMWKALKSLRAAVGPYLALALGIGASWR